ncbi:unnamed protein product [Protopolystoma xenopodis]|uniref:Uncharacterized protein n=1 Tax=Protopolystoma xenopodis TaxID=117903 RepID=A0A448XJT1_9PLAT|nr:unnamed protein product [Protopolystoma xenopodis]
MSLYACVILFFSLFERRSSNRVAVTVKNSQRHKGEGSWDHLQHLNVARQILRPFTRSRSTGWSSKRNVLRTEPQSNRSALSHFISSFRLQLTSPRSAQLWRSQSAQPHSALCSLLSRSRRTVCQIKWITRNPITYTHNPPHRPTSASPIG